MGWGDNRKSPKMRRRQRQRKLKERLKRRLEANRLERAQRKQGE